ncbi:MAG: phosphoribosylformylglycinamidine cyclo-ligase [Pseudanabaenaceae cyanobacterium SKYGB_i_bin29]|nr:phosphoribosylformylglycinamidine cyclo-ligase [Pseudanabaenaceae cyanobacterium SKYG29]MDW8422405.1 phosphoribosylformylglycinamidine cyclo-ligase [Pseudanabaenaceae cyanobacterium SKYGB_i_bin29]
MDYKTAGVDVEAGREFVQRIRDLVHSTHRPGVIGGIGGFGGLFALPSGYREPVLVAGTDGVGTKLKIAQALNCHTTIGIDLVAMCVNDVLTTGAEPLFFLDYLATGKLEPDQLQAVIEGIVAGCREAGCALIGGETAEMPGFYQAGEYDVAGFCVGIVEKAEMITPDRVQIGDYVIGLASSGFHSNGFSLIRRVIADQGWSWHDRLPELGREKTIGEWCLTPTRIYVSIILEALRSGVKIHGLAHITGGGIPENLPRCLPPHCAVNIVPWDIPPLFRWLQAVGQIPTADMFNTFNMGIGMAVVVPTLDYLEWFRQKGVECYGIGQVVSGNGTIENLY